MAAVSGSGPRMRSAGVVGAVLDTIRVQNEFSIAPVLNFQCTDSIMNLVFIYPRATSSMTRCDQKDYGDRAAFPQIFEEKGIH